MKANHQRYDGVTDFTFLCQMHELTVVKSTKSFKSNTLQMMSMTKNQIAIMPRIPKGSIMVN